uniref:Uncharacterized protein n=1 Tax=Meloidogyne floridensis TaxID=298350 RepID=A0A915NYQ2_9BILA
MSFIFPHNPLPSPGTKIIAIKVLERSSLAPCIGEKKVIAKKAYSMGDKNYVVLPPRVRAIPISDLTIFGGSSGTRPEKYEIPEFVGRLEDQTYLNGDNFVLRIGYKGCPEPLLALFNAQREDGGFYNCRIENANGVRETGCHIFITNDGPGGPRGMQRSYRSVLYTPSQRYSRY